jgi:uncharacterized Zn-finger protein
MGYHYVPATATTLAVEDVASHVRNCSDDQRVAIECVSQLLLNRTPGCERLFDTLHQDDLAVEQVLMEKPINGKNRFKRNRENKFESEICLRKYSQKQHLKTHILTHSGEKPFECGICWRKYSQKQYLKTHILTHRKAV